MPQAADNRLIRYEGLSTTCHIAMRSPSALATATTSASFATRTPSVRVTTYDITGLGITSMTISVGTGGAPNEFDGSPSYGAALARLAARGFCSASHNFCSYWRIRASKLISLLCCQCLGVRVSTTKCVPAGRSTRSMILSGLFVPLPCLHRGTHVEPMGTEWGCTPPITT